MWWKTYFTKKKLGPKYYVGHNLSIQTWMDLKIHVVFHSDGTYKNFIGNHFAYLAPNPQKLAKNHF
jgi:hypothetical protein